MLSNKQYRRSHRPHEAYMRNIISGAFIKLNELKNLNLAVKSVDFDSQYGEDRRTGDEDFILYVKIYYVDKATNTQYGINELEQMLFEDEVSELDKAIGSANLDITDRHILRVARRIFANYTYKAVYNINEG